MTKTVLIYLSNDLFLLPNSASKYLETILFRSIESFNNHSSEICKILLIFLITFSQICCNNFQSIIRNAHHHILPKF